MNVKLETSLKCPFCGEEEMILMPTDKCIRRYVCRNCKSVLEPKDKDCCVFCSYAENKCPSKQQENDSNMLNLS